MEVALAALEWWHLVTDQILKWYLFIITNKFKWKHKEKHIIIFTWQPA